MSDKEYINEVSDIVLDVIGVGSFVLANSVNKYTRRNSRTELFNIINRYDLNYGYEEGVELSIKDLIEQEILIKHGASIKRSHTTRNINHRNN